jgi:hypothetical protein
MDKPITPVNELFRHSTLQRELDTMHDTEVRLPYSKKATPGDPNPHITVGNKLGSEQQRSR